MRRRHRLHNGLPQQEQQGILRPVAGLLIIAAVLFLASKWVLNEFGVGNAIQRLGATLTLENGGTVSVSIDGGERRRAEEGQKLYPGDRVITGVDANASLMFFDGTIVRLDQSTDILLNESYHGVRESELDLRLTDGSLWTLVPTQESYSGSIVRTFSTPSMNMTLPSRTEAVVTPVSLVVFAADGIGVPVEVKDATLPVVVGEGQLFRAPETPTTDDDIYAYRSPIDPLAVPSRFVEESRAIAQHQNSLPIAAGPNAPAGNFSALTVSTPEDGARLLASTVDVKGSVGQGIDRVRINGYNAPIDEQTHTFSQELALPDEDTVEVVVTALDSTGEPVAEIRRSVERDRKPPAPPTIESPAKGDQTYRTQSERFVIEGTAPADAIGIVVNDYRLQLFNPGDGDWRYLASTSIDNLHPGENVYSVVAINRGGYKSEPVTLTILLEEGPEGVIATEQPPAEDGGTSNAPATEEDQEDPSSLPDNEPLAAGTLHVTQPSPGNSHIAHTGSLLIEGGTTPLTASVWVNDYKLRLYEAGKTFWNYIADTQLNTMKRGTNTYKIVTRDAQNRVLDRLVYTIEYNP